TSVLGWLPANNGKLIIWDSDSCSSSLAPNYQWLAPLGASFDVFTAGQQGASGGGLSIVDQNNLGNNNLASPYHIDTAALVSQTHGVGDLNVVNENTAAPVWCAHMRGTNIVGNSGFARMYSKVGGLIGAPESLIIYCGFDADYLNLTSPAGATNL